MAKEKPGQTLQATALFHEAWIKLAGGEAQNWNNRPHFFAAAAMRRTLIDLARKRGRAKHGGGGERLDLNSIELADTATDDQLLAVVLATRS